MQRIVATTMALVLLVGACDDGGDEPPGAPPPAPGPAAPPSTTTTIEPAGCDDDLVDDVLDLLQDQLDALAASPISEVRVESGLVARQEEIAARVVEEGCSRDDLRAQLRSALSELEAEGTLAERYRVVIVEALFDEMQEP